jgi:hypothetical protein
MSPTAMGDLKATLQASVFFNETQKQLREATTQADLERAARAMDSADFDRLPAEAREDLGAYYAHRLLLITGALAP